MATQSEDHPFTKEGAKELKDAPTLRGPLPTPDALRAPTAGHAQEMPLQAQHEETASLLHRNRNLAILYAIAGHLNRKVDVHEALQEVLAQVTKLLGMQTGWVWLLDEQDKPYLAAAQSLPPYLADHPQRMTGSCLCLDTFLQGSLEGAANIDVLRCSRLKKAENENDPSSLGLRFHASVPIYARSEE